MDNFLIRNTYITSISKLNMIGGTFTDDKFIHTINNKDYDDDTISCL